MSLGNPVDASVRSAALEDAPAVANIYNHYVAHTAVTFEDEAVPAHEISRRIADANGFALPWLVAERDGAIVGYAYAARWRARRAYRFSTELTAYVAADQLGRGVGSVLYTHLIAELRKCQVHAAMGGIALPNDASVALHEKFGFRKVAHFDQVGFKFNRWIDVGYWQLLL